MSNVYEEVKAFAERVIVYRGEAFDRLVQQLTFWEELRLANDAFDREEMNRMLDHVNRNWTWVN